MKILHVTRQFHPLVGGLENYVLALAEEQVKMGHDVTVVTLNKSFIDGQKLPATGKINNINVKRIPYSGVKKYPLAPSVFKHLKNHDLIHVHAVDFFLDFIAFTKVFHKKKFVLHTHGGFFHTSWARIFKKIFFHTITRASLLAVHKVVASSDNDYKTFSDISRKIIRIDNGVQVNKFIRVSKESIEKNTIIYIGRIDIHKGIGKLIDLIAYLHANGSRATLRVVGPDWKGLVPSFLKKAADAGVSDSVHFLGIVDNDTMLEELSKACVFVSASEYEGFGISAVEAMASGTPCILNDIPSFRKIANGSSFAKIVNYNKIQEAAEAVNYFLNLDSAEYLNAGVMARKTAQKYSWSTVAKSIMKEII